MPLPDPGLVPKWTLLSDAKRAELERVVLKGWCSYCHTYLPTLADLARHNMVTPPAVNQWGTCHVFVEVHACTGELIGTLARIVRERKENA